MGIFKLCIVIVVACTSIYAQEIGLDSIYRRFYQGQYVTVSETFLQSTEPLSSTDRMMLAYSFFKLGDYSQAEAVMKDVEISTGFLELCRQFLNYIILFEQDPTIAQTYYINSDLFNDTFFQDFVFLSSSRQYLKSKDFLGFERQMARLNVIGAIPSFRPFVLELFYYFYTISEDQKNADKVLRELMVSHPIFSDQLGLLKDYNLRFDESFTMDEQLRTDQMKINRLEILYSQRQYDQLIEEGDRFLPLIEKEKKKGAIYYWMGRAFYKQLNFFRAEEMFRRAMFHPLNREQILESLYVRGECHFHMKDYTLAFEPWNMLIDQFPNSKWVPQVYYWLIHFFKVSKKKELYAEYMDRLKREFPNSVEYQSLLWQSLWHDRASEKNITSSVDARQWLQTMFGAPDLVDFLHSYYSQLKYRYRFDSFHEVFLRYPILFRTKRKLDVIFTGNVLANRNDTIQQSIEEAYRAGFGDLFELYNRVMHDLRSEYQNFEEQQIIIDYYLEDFQNVFEVFNDIIVNKPEALSETVVRFYSPEVLGQSIYNQSKRYSVDPLFMQSVIKRASAYDETLRIKDRFGLFQIDRDAIDRINQRLGMGNLDDKRVVQIPINIRLGSFYFSWLMEQYEDVPHYGVYSYLMGPLFTKKMTDAKGMQYSLIDFVDRSLFVYVREFIEDVNENIVFYYLRKHIETPLDQSETERLPIIQGFPSVYQ